MNQRDQNRHERTRYEQRPEQGLRGQRQGRYGAMPEAGGEQQRPPSRSRFTDTYNPEPQWLRGDESGRRYGQPLGGGDYDRNDEDYRGGRYATGSRESAGHGRGRHRDDEPGYGQRQGRQYSARQQAGATGYGRDHGRERGRYGQRMGGRWDEDHPEPGQYQGAYAEYGAGRFEEEDRGYGRSPYGASGYRESEYRGQGHGADYAGQAQRSRSGLQFASDYGGGGYDQVSGTYGYRSRGAYATGDDQFRMQGSGMEGQRSYRGVGPQAYRRSDDRIRDDVCERLTDDARIDASNVTIDVNQGAVTLSGTVPERYMRYAAEDLVDDAMGVESINNQLRVQARGMQSQGMQSQGLQPSGDTTPMASGSRATAPSDLEKSKH